MISLLKKGCGFSSVGKVFPTLKNGNTGGPNLVLCQKIKIRRIDKNKVPKPHGQLKNIKKDRNKDCVNFLKTYLAHRLSDSLMVTICKLALDMSVLPP